MNRQHHDEPKDFIDWALVLALVFGFAAGLVDIRILRGHSWPLVVRVAIAGDLSSLHQAPQVTRWYILIGNVTKDIIEN